MNITNLRFSLILTALLGTCSWTAKNANAQLFAIDSDSNNLYTVSTLNAALSLVGHIAGPVGELCEIQFSPDGTLYGFNASPSNTSKLYRIDPATAAATMIGPLNLAGVGEGGLAFAPDGTAYAAEAGSAQVPKLFTINLVTGGMHPLWAQSAAGNVTSMASHIAAMAN